jgi:3-methyladenine DNA glycosylase AlkD
MSLGTKTRARDVVAKLKALGTPERASSNAWFFKTGKGQYGHGDIFYGVTVPQSRSVAKQFRDLPLPELDTLLKHKVHECRLAALQILVEQYRRGDEKERDRIAKFYVARAKYINNWDLVDLSAPNILGPHLLHRKRNVLYRFARSKNLWERRISILSTLAFIRAGEFDDTLAIAELLLNDDHDLMHKAVGWMLREVGKRSLVTEKAFLDKHVSRMPRTALRYAIERFPERERRAYLAR